MFCTSTRFLSLSQYKLFQKENESTGLFWELQATVYIHTKVDRAVLFTLFSQFGTCLTFQSLRVFWGYQYQSKFFVAGDDHLFLMLVKWVTNWMTDYIPQRNQSHEELPLFDRTGNLFLAIILLSALYKGSVIWYCWYWLFFSFKLVTTLFC